MRGVKATCGIPTRLVSQKQARLNNRGTSYNTGAKNIWGYLEEGVNMAYTKRVDPFSAIVAVIAFAFMFCLVILNRGSEKVVTTFLTAVAAIILAGMYSKDRPPDGTFSQKVAFWINNEKTATGLIVVFLALVLAVFVFCQQTPLKNTFPAMLCYQLRDRSYVQLSGFHDLAYDGGFYVEQLKAVRPDLFREGTNIGDFEEARLVVLPTFITEQS